MRGRYFLERRVARAFALKDYEKAIESLSDLLSSVGENPNTLHAAAVCHQRLGRHEQALDFAKRGIAADAGHLGCLQVLTESHVARGNMEAARQFALRALDRVEVMAIDDPPSGMTTGRLAPIRIFSRTAAGARASHQDWITWANQLLNRQPSVGNS